MKNRYWLVLSVILVLMAVLILPSCTKGTTTATTSTASKYGGTLTIGHATDSLSFFTPTMMRGQDLTQGRTSIESLARFNAQGQLVPWLAESWDTDANAKTVILKLKKGITFHDGSDFNATACKWNIETFINAKRAEVPPLTSIDIIDDYTLKFNLVDWNNTVIIGLCYFAGPQLSPTAWQKAGTTDQERNEWATTNPVGTGPFKLVSRERDVNQVYQKFEEYWQNGKPYLDGIKWVFIADPTIASSSFSSGDIDILESPPATEANNLRVKGINITELTTGLGATQVTLVGSSAVQDSPFANLKVRQALTYAIDKQALVDNQAYGWGVPTNQWGVPTGFWANPDVIGYPYNPDKAKQLIAEAGYPNGITTKLLTGDTADQVSMATAIQGMLAKVGINAELDIAAGARKDNLDRTGFVGLDILYIRADSDLAMILPRYVGASGAIVAKSIIHPDKIEKLLVEAKQAPDQESKRAKIWETQKAIFDEYSLVTSCYVTVNLCAKKPYVHDDGMNIIQLDEWTPEDAWLSAK